MIPADYQLPYATLTLPQQTLLHFRAYTVLIAFSQYLWRMNPAACVARGQPWT
jgi:hypothetical protein